MDRLLAALDAAGGETRFVGGCVRDTLLGLDASDVDLATRIAPEAVIARLETARIKAVPTGLAHGTITAVIGGKPVEVTTLRRDVATDGRRATIAYTEDWREDAARRDFTINALSADPASGEVFDYFEGLADLEAGRVRFIGDPLQRIAEDHLRILRFFRFHARFGKGAPDEAALAACAARANDLMALSRERIADELRKLLDLPDPGETVALMQARGIFAPIVPEIGPDGVAALRRLIRREALLHAEPFVPRRLAALLPRDEAVARAVGARLRLSNGWRARIEEYARPSDRVRDPRALVFYVGRARAGSLLLLDDIDDGALVEQMARIEGWEPPRFRVRGGDLLKAGVPEGPIIARTLHAIQTEWVESGFDDGALPDIVRRHVDQALRSSQ
ncbi:MAG TPA: CCA tRNA nucleotidyltransferase [Allosphingosinicella sp.]|jgi:poly(A) polymerase|nr:CCA tRNA nucleotidyltransferase [Allosphingosinicella sp.]